MKTTDRVALAVAALVPFAAFALGAASRQRARQRAQPRTVPPSPEPEDPRAPRWLASPSRRNWLATFASMLPLAAFIWVIVSDPAQRAEEWSLPVVMVFWGTFALVHSGLTVAALWGLEGDRLHRSIVLVKRRDFGMTSSARSLAVQTPLVVLVIVAVIVLTPAFRGDRYLVALTLAFVVIAWINTALLFAENYIAQGSRGFAFPGGGADRVRGLRLFLPRRADDLRHVRRVDHRPRHASQRHDPRDDGLRVQHHHHRDDRLVARHRLRPERTVRAARDR